MKLTIWQKNILSMLVIVVAGFILFNVAFILAFLVNRVFNLLIFSPIDWSGGSGTIHGLWHYVYVFLILLISWFIFRSRLKDLWMAAYLTMPLMVVLAEVGLHLYRWPVLVWTCGAVIAALALFFLYKSKRSWVYYFAVLFVVAVGIVVLTSGMEI